MVEHHDHLPGGIPAVWEWEDCPYGVLLRLHLLKGMPVEQADHFRSMALREVCPDVTFDSFTITTEAVPVAAVSA